LNATPVDPASGVVYPVGLRLHGRRVVVVGGGQVAHRRVAGLLEAGALVTVVSPEATPALEGLVEPGSLSWERRRYEDGVLAGAWFAVAATDDPAVNAAVAAEAERTHTFCARADDRAASSVWTPAVGRQDDLVIGVHGGGDPQRAIGVRDAVLAGLTDGRIADRASRAATQGRGSVVLVGGGPGDPGLITVRGHKAVAQADVVVADHLAPQSLLASLPPEVEVIDASKLPRGRSMAQEQINALLVEHALAGIPVTHRGLTHEFVVVSGHLPPGHPRSLVDWAAIARLRGTVVVLMGVDTAPAIAAALVENGRAPETPVAVVSNGSLPTERVVRTTLAGLPAAVADGAVRPPAVWVVGEVVTRDGLAAPAGLDDADPDVDLD
jgi:uroporphyrin-III C-methyltransferase/precorrin-2 dehydrogenase/sirohydrochlorin ferrochelatase